MEIANTILQQMGGANRIAAMTGAQFLALDNGVQFRFKGSRIANSCRVILDPSDTYTVEFHKITKRGLNCKVVKSLSGVYCDMLTEIFESTTGLYLSL